MERIRQLILFLSLSVFLFACEKEELPILAYNRGDVSTASIGMGPTYKNQLFYKLATESIVSTNDKAEWDLAFDCTSEHIFLNSSKLMYAWNTGQTSMSSVTDTTGLDANKKWDSPTGMSDSTAIGDLASLLHQVFIINRGYNDIGTHQGFRKMMVQSAGSGSYTFTYSNLDGTATNTKTITASSTHNKIYYSFTTNSEVAIEPAKNNYDLLFTQYTQTFYDPLQSYLVTGVFINPYYTRVSKITNKTFNDIALSDTTSHPFSNYVNSIGYDWKVYDFGTSLYVVDANYCYIISDNEGFFWKLHFIDFYNELGIKGYPKFEFKKL